MLAGVLAETGAGQLRLLGVRQSMLEQFPPYCPDLNPVEGI